MKTGKCLFGIFKFDPNSPLNNTPGHFKRPWHVKHYG